MLCIGGYNKLTYLICKMIDIFWCRDSSNALKYNYKLRHYIYIMLCIGGSNKLNAMHLTIL